MNVFVLNTGRCGSVTFARACQHITNFSCDHESLISLAGINRLNYADQHIEVDNRLSWFLGRLDREYGNDALYVHLQRTKEDVVNSFVKRQDFGIMQAYRDGIYMDIDKNVDAETIAADYIDTVEANIRLFLKGKSFIQVQLSTIDKDFAAFWSFIGAEGDFEKALAEFDTAYNAS